MGTIQFYKNKSEFLTDEQCYIVELQNDSSDEICSIARARVQPGVTTSLHKLQGVVERYVIISGIGRVKIEDQQEQTLEAFDVVIIPQGKSQQITNIGKDDLIFLCICTPRFKQENYVSIGDST